MPYQSETVNGNVLRLGAGTPVQTPDIPREAPEH